MTRPQEEIAKVTDRLQEIIQVRAGMVSGLYTAEDRMNRMCEIAAEVMIDARTLAAGLEAEGWQPIETAPKDGTQIWLLIASDDDRVNPLEDSDQPTRTVGHNNFVNDGEDQWLFAGWNWENDYYTEGHGNPCAWQPLPAAPAEGSGES